MFPDTSHQILLLFLHWGLPGLIPDLRCFHVRSATAQKEVTRGRLHLPPTSLPALGRCHIICKPLDPNNGRWYGYLKSSTPDTTSAFCFPHFMPLLP